MSIEIQQLNASISASVSKLWQLPLSISATGSVVTVCPSDADIWVTVGTLKNGRDWKKLNPGYILKFENSMVVQAQTLGIGNWEKVGDFFRAQKDTLDPNTTITVTYDSDLGYFIASAPCYGVILVKSYEYTVKVYDYDPSPTIWDDKSNVCVGVAYAKTKLPPGTKDQQVIPTIKSCDIPVSGIQDSFERYRISLPTVVTDKGEWHLPKDFDKDTYDPANAYPDAKDGKSKEGPSKDNGWVRKDVPIEIGHVGLSGSNAKYTRSPIPSNIQGVQVVDAKLETPKRPLEWPAVKKKGDTDPWDTCGSIVTDRCKIYTSKENPVFPEGIKIAAAVIPEYAAVPAKADAVDNNPPGS